MNQRQKKLLAFFVLFYLTAFFIFNWNDVSWIFNYRTVSCILYDFFNPYPNIEAFSISNSSIPTNNSINYSVTNDNSQQKEYPYSSKTNTLEVPSIGISAPIILSQSTDVNVMTKDLDNGVAYYPGSVLPGQTGQTIILGHSAPLNWPKVKYDWVFSDLNNLNNGEQIHVHFGHKKYIYVVKEKKILEKGQEIAPLYLENNNNVLVLVSCWPPGKNLKRIAVYAELES